MPSDCSDEDIALFKNGIAFIQRTLLFTLEYRAGRVQIWENRIVENIEKLKHRRTSKMPANLRISST
jgi:hypothetical protein